MIIESISLHNFMPYYGENTIVFPEDPHANTTVFFGENTKGKTSILNAFRWVLYGEAESKGRQLKYVDLLNKKAESEGKNEVAVEIRFRDDTRQFMVHRSLKSAADSAKGKMLVEIDGKPVSQEEALQEIERIAPSGTRRFFLFDGELLREYEELMEPTNATAKKIKKAVEDVMGFPSLVRSISILEQVEKKLRKESIAERTSNEAVNKLKEERESIQETLSHKERELRDLLALEERDTKKLSEIGLELDQSKEQQDKYQELIAKRARRDQLKESIEAHREQLKLKKRLLWKAILKPMVNSSVKPAIAAIEKRTEIDKALSAATSTKDALQAIQDTNTCPTCNQTASLSEELRTQLKKAHTDISDCERKLSEIGDNPSMWLGVNEKYQDAPALADFLSSEGQLEKLSVSHDSAVKEVRTLTEELIDFDGDRVESTLQQKVHLQQALESNAKAAQELDKSILEDKQRSLHLSKQIQDQSDSETVSKEGALLFTQTVSQLFENAKAVLREQIKIHVEAAAKEAFLEMTSRPDDYLGLRITDSYGLEIIASDGTVVPQRSAGAEQVVALALIDGLNRVGRSPGPVIMDTPFGRLDETHRANVLKYMPNSARQFMVFVHSGELKKDADMLGAINHKVGRRYEIKSSGPYESYIESV